MRIGMIDINGGMIIMYMFYISLLLDYAYILCIDKLLDQQHILYLDKANNTLGVGQNDICLKQPGTN